MVDWSRWSRQKREEQIQLLYERLTEEEVVAWVERYPDRAGKTDDDRQDCAEDLDYWYGEEE